MTDHRITDLSYGHLGKASYDPEEKQWIFSVETKQQQRIWQLSPLKECLPPSIQTYSKEDTQASRVARSQLKWLPRARPETFPANEIASTFAITLPPVQPELESHFGPLLSIGRAVDSGHLSGSATPQIMAMPCGEAGHILRLVKPRIESRGWGKQSRARLSLWNTQSSDHGYWLGTGGTIRQIAFADEENGTRAWLAVRQATTITIFQPVYGKTRGSVSSESGASRIYMPSQLNPNPLAVLAAERSGSRSHVDISFNPWYARQFVVIDPLGKWGIWNIEGHRGQNSSMKLASGKTGGIYDGQRLDSTSESPSFDHVDGWHRILWVCNISMIIMCSRRHVAVFDLKAKPTRLDSSEFLAANNSDWILDIKRSTANFNHVFVLTTSRIFWIKISPAEERLDQKGGHVGAKVLLSYRHFRDANDESMKLSILKDDNLYVLISSGKTNLVNFYCFLTEQTMNDPVSWQGSFVLASESDNNGLLNCIYTLPVPIIPTSSKRGDDCLELRYFKQGVRFFQIWTLTSTLGLESTLCATHNVSKDGILQVKAPMTKISRTFRRMGARDFNDSFIVPDWVDEEKKLVDLSQALARNNAEPVASENEGTNDLQLRMDWREIFRTIFLQDDISDGPLKLGELLASVSDLIQHGVEEEKIVTGTLGELLGQTNFTENLDKVAIALSEFIKSLQLKGELDGPSTLILSDLTVCSSIKLPIAEDKKSPNVMKVYDQLVDNWMTSLPLKVSNAARGAKFKAIRQIAIELCLSSRAISLQNKASKISATGHGNYDNSLDLKMEATTRESSPADFFSSQLSAVSRRDLEASLSTPTRTPSLSSHTTSEITEDSAISRLRQYALSVKSRPDFGHSKMLFRWPCTPGVDPATYSYEALQKAATAEENEDESHQENRREKARRRKRIERLLNLERASVAKSATPQSLASQPASFKPSGSQPVALSHPGFSSQTVVDGMPMTQPESGAFGSRTMQKGKTKQKKQKKQRTAGF